MKRATILLKAFVLLFVVFGVAACDSFDDLLGDDPEVHGVIQSISGDVITLDDGSAYRTNSDTKYDGISGLSDLSAGLEVEIEYKDRGSERIATEIELASNDNDD